MISEKLIQGQLISVLVAATGVINAQLFAQYNVSLPLFANMLMYIILFSFNFALYASDRDVVKKPFNILYAFTAFADVHGNILSVLAFRFTSITSVMLLDCTTIPCVMILSYCLLKTTYSRLQICSVCICGFGILLVIYSDHENSVGTSLTGDLLAVAAAICYAVSNVSQEMMVKKYNRVEYLMMLGLYGGIISCIEFFIFEFEHFFVDGVWLIAAYVVVLFTIYNVVSMFLMHHDAALLNLSLLTSDVWSLLAGVFLFHQVLSWMYIVGFLGMLVGIVGFIEWEEVSPLEEFEEQLLDEVP